MQIPEETYRRKVMGCWLGKAIGGTLGMPCEGRDGPFDLEFYDPVPVGTVPNDDLDLQVLWACILDRMRTPAVDRNTLAAAWVGHVGFPWDEYGVAIRNIKMGLKPPLTGSYDNYFINGMGAAIRTEIWACLAAGDPQLAAAYAYEDACVDHDKEGLWATVFLATLECAAFCESDPDSLLDAAVAPLPESSLVRLCVTDTRRWFAADGGYLKTRLRVLEKYGHENFTDVVQNMGFIVLGWLAGKGDFGRSICIATNCGKDTDCTAATVGALMGIIDPDCIDEKWLAPIGKKLIVSKEITGISYPDTLDGLTDLVVDLRRRLDYRKPAPADEISEDAVKKYEITVSHAFVKAAPSEHMQWVAATAKLDAEGTPLTLPGTFARMDAGQFKNDIMMLRYRFELDKELDVRVMFNSSSYCMVWIDGNFAFGRDHGVMAPSPHRCPINQSKDMRLPAGMHELVAAVYKPTFKPFAEWVIAVADRKDMQWIPNVFR